MSEIRPFAGTSRRIITCDDHASYWGVLYSKQVYHVTHVLQTVVYAPVYVFCDRRRSPERITLDRGGNQHLRSCGHILTDDGRMDDLSAFKEAVERSRAERRIPARSSCFAGKAWRRGAGTCGDDQSCSERVIARVLIIKVRDSDVHREML